MFKTINGGQLPQRATKYSAGFDVFANEDVEIMAGETVTVGLGIALDRNAPLNITGKRYILENLLDIGFYLELHPRSSLRAKGMGGGVGIIDIDYPDEIKIVLSNPIIGAGEWGHYANTYSIKRGDKIGQLILKRHEGCLLPAQYTKDEERNGGFGSTD